MTPEELRMVGASDAAAIVGLSPYRAPIDVWRRCMGEVVEAFNPKVLRRGQLLEPVIRAMAVEEFALNLQGPRKVVDPKRPYLRLSLDDVHAPNEVVEFKSVSGFSAHTYAEGLYPAWHEPQVQLYAHALGAPRARLIALIGMDDLRQHVIEADAELQAILLDAIDRFWRDHVVAGKPPPPDSTESYSEWLAHRYPESKGELLQADAEASKWAAELRKAKADAKDAEARERLARNWLQARIGEADGIQGDGWKVTYKSTKGRPTVDWQAVAMEAEIPPSLVEAHTSRKPFRTFRTSFKELSDE